MVSIDFLYLNRPVIDQGHIPDLSSNIKIPCEYCIFNGKVEQNGKFRKFYTAMRGIFVCLLEAGNCIVQWMEVASYMLVIAGKWVWSYKAYNSTKKNDVLICPSDISLVQCKEGNSFRMYQECLLSNHGTDVQQSNEYCFYGGGHTFSARSTSRDVFGVRDNELAHLSDMFTVRTGRDWDPQRFVSMEITLKHELANHIISRERQSLWSSDGVPTLRSEMQSRALTTISSCLFKKFSNSWCE